MRTGLILVAVMSALVFGAAEARADSINNFTGLSSPATVVNFNEFGIATDTVVTTQYSSLGLEFTTLMRQYPNSKLANFQPVSSPIVIEFTGLITEAAFALGTNLGTTTTFTALLGGTSVESFSANTNQDLSHFYGFSNITFDSIRIDVVGNINNAAIISTAHLGTVGAPVPEPGSIALLGLGLVGLGIAHRRRKARAS